MGFRHGWMGGYASGILHAFAMNHGTDSSTGKQRKNRQKEVRGTAKTKGVKKAKGDK